MRQSIDNETMRKVTTLRTELLIKALDFTSKLMKVDPSEICNTSRERNVCLARHLTRYYLYSKEKITYTEIGKLMNCNHASVIHSVSYVTNTSTVDKYIYTLKQSIDRELLPEHFTMREQIKNCLDIYTTINTKTEAILEVFRGYEETYKQKKMVVREEDTI